MNSGSMNRSSGNYRVLAEAVGRLGNEVLDWRHKSVPPMADGRSVADLVLARTSLAEWGTPLPTLDRGAIAQNVAVMAKWCSARGLELAPHGKTTMAPELFLAQLRAGAWGITLANEPQLRVGRAFGLPKILLAGSFLRPDGLRWLVAQQMADPDFRFSSWVDSVRSVELMTSALPAGSNIDVCVELGVDGGRTGARGVGAALEVARAVQRSSRLRLIGVSGYEGAVGQGAGADQIGAVDRYLDDIARVWTAVGPMVDLTTAGRAMITVGGSAYFDRVADRLAEYADPVGKRGPAVEVVLRSGAYIVHDDGYYRSITPAGRGDGPVLKPAMHAWARVVSHPEPALALLDAGRRDLPFDQGMPEPQMRRPTDGSPEPLTGAQIFALNDQHAFLSVRNSDDVEVGDVVRLGLSHPCTAMDKWTLIPVLDDAAAPDPRVVGMIRTFF